jgi:hypothetical protein
MLNRQQFALKSMLFSISKTVTVSGTGGDQPFIAVPEIGGVPMLKIGGQPSWLTQYRLK